MIQSTYASQIHDLERLTKKIIYGLGCNEGDIDICVMVTVDRMCLKKVKVITWELQHNLVEDDVDKKLQ